MRVVLKLALIFVLVLAGVKIWYGRLQERLLLVPVVKETVQVQKPAPEKEPLRKSEDYKIIVDRNIFQALITETEQKKEEVKPEELEPTKLKLSLMGEHDPSIKIQFAVSRIHLNCRIDAIFGIIPPTKLHV